MNNMKITVILVFLLVLSIVGIVNASNTKSVTIISTVNVTAPPQINETSISGYVINNSDKSGLQNWNVQLFGITGKGRNIKLTNIQTSTNSDGFYKFNNLQEGRYILSLRLKSGYIPVGRTTLQVNLKTNQKSVNNNFTVSKIKSRPVWWWNW